MFFGNKFGVLFTGPIVALDQQVHHVAETSGEFVLIFDEPRTMLNDPRDTGGIKVTQSITVTIIADETGKRHNVLHGSIDLEVEVSFHLESFAEIGVHRRESAIEIRIANHDDFCICWNRLRPQTLRSHPAKKRGGFFDS